MEITIMIIFQFLYVITALGTMLVVISENRNPLKTISWVLVLLLLPLVGLFIYYFFGEDGRKRRLISRKIHKMINRGAITNNAPCEDIPIPEEHEPLINLLDRAGENPLYGNSSVVFFSDGKTMFDNLFADIEKAKHHIHIQFYIFADDKLGTALKQLLIKKAKEGVEVRLLYDDVGSWSTRRKFFNTMEAEGVEVQPFLKVAFKYLASRVNYRNHRKVVLIDGLVGYMGGMNVADRYVEGVDFGVWRDSQIKIEGKAVAGLQVAFMIDWYSARQELLTSPLYFPPLERKGNVAMQIATSGPVGTFKDIHLGILQAIANARKSIYIQTPYFIPTDALLLAIQQASLRGVDVRLMVPRKSDTTFVKIATMSFLKEALDTNVKVYFFEAGFLHSKLMTVDDSLTITGSANMDVRSFEHNFEIDAFIYDKGTCKKANEIFYKDMKDSTSLSLEKWEERSRITKFKESVMRLFSPLL